MPLEPFTTIAAGVWLYALARRGPQWRRIVAVVLAVLFGVAAASAETEALLGELFAESSLFLLPVMLAVYHRRREDHVAELVALAAAEQVRAERLRIAHDLHDVVAHGLSVIAVQSGVAAHLADGNDGPTADALRTINEVSRGSLAELRSTVGVLRTTPVDATA